jgi:VWFA-related protein
MRSTKRFSLLAVLAAAAAAQTGPVFRATSNLVVVDVFVRDRSGKDIPDLKKEDFTLLEDGKKQAISVFEYQRLDSEVLPAPQAPKALAPRPAPAAAPPSPIRYQDRRLIVLFFDQSSMAPQDQIRAEDAALRFLDRQMTASDLVCVMSYSSHLRTLQDFTGDRDKLAAAIHSLRVGESSDLAALADTGTTDTGEDTGAAFTADDTEFNIFNTDLKLAALESAVKLLAGLPEKKALIYLSSGAGKTGVENQSQLRSTVNAAVRANVSFYPIDVRGLIAMAPAGNASQAASRGNGLFTGAQQTSMRDSIRDQQETLSSLAADTGGKVFLDSNDLTLGMAQAQQDIRSYYVLGYYSTNPAQDGRYRRVQVKLTSNLQAKLDYRGGYFGPKEFGAFTADDKENQLQQALMLGDPITDLPLALEVNYFRLGRDRYFVPVAVKIPSSAIVLAKKGANEVTDFDFVGQVLDSRGAVVSSVRDGVTVKLNEATVAQLARRSFQYDTGFTLAPGDYRIRFLARENRTGKMGTFETAFRIPDLSARSDYLHISSVVWSSQREPLGAAVGSASSNKKLIAANPLVEGDAKLIPSITRVFRKDQDLYVYLEAYDAAPLPASKRAELTAAVSFFRGKAKALETAPAEFSAPAVSRPGVYPVRIAVPLAKLTPGDYTCQVSVVDGVGKKFAFSRSRMVLLP